MAYWLFKEEPSCYSFSKLLSDGRTIWDGIGNALALQNLRKVKKGDRIFCYHTGKEKAVVGIMQAISGPYPDPAQDDEKLAVVDVKPVKALPNPVTLKEIKANPEFKDWDLIRNSRLSVMPVSKNIWDRILEMSRGD